MSSFNRKSIRYLLEWKERAGRKPLILRGARQVGKTTLVRTLAVYFDHYIELNLEKGADREIFETTDEVKKILQLLFLRNNILRNQDKTVLLFIDEIQHSANAIRQLRYFFEEAKEIHVIAAGSVLESLMNRQISFPVGRVEYLMLRPFSYDEFLDAAGEKLSLDILDKIPVPDYAHGKLMDLFTEYCLIGGMPEIIKNYIEHHDLVAAGKIFRNLITTYLDDVEKYAEKDKEVSVIRHVIQSSLRLAGERIKFEGFGDSNYKSKDISEAFRTLERTYLISLVYPTTNVQVPLTENRKKSPKLHTVDTGILNYYAGIQVKLLSGAGIDTVFEGKVAEHIVGQELLAIHPSPLYRNVFWVRDKKQSGAEIDYIIQHNSLLIPVEVKRGKTGKLRSLMEFMDACPHGYAVRIYSGKLSIDKVKTFAGKDFLILNLPFYLTGRIREYLHRFISEKS